jgi:DNA-directed RNA polymerase subunit RPC12/RpoP
MSELRRYRCLNCGKRFDIEVLTPEEVKRAREERRPTSAIHCPDCRRTSVREGWD